LSQARRLETNSLPQHEIRNRKIAALPDGGLLRINLMASKDVLVCGTLNLETTLPVDAFPVAYEPVRYRRFELRSQPSGVGFNVARALTVLGNRVRLASLVGVDFLGRALREALPEYGLSDELVLPRLEETPQSVVVFDGAGRRMIHTDLKDLGEKAYPTEPFEQALRGCCRTVMTNANFSRPLLALAKAAGASVATDLQTASEASRPYDADFLRAGDIIFSSHEKLGPSPEGFVASLWQCTDARVIVVGMGAAGALLCLRGQPSRHLPAVEVRPVVNTAGAGDALFACFLHFYWDGEAPLAALRKALVFAAYKVGENGASRGFLPEDQLLRLAASANGPI
jgi:acarbose 7IV-phosphotransferase